MPIERTVLSRDQVRFEIRLAVGGVPKSVWVRVRGKDRLASEAALEQVVEQIAASFAKLEVTRSHDPAAMDWRQIGNRLNAAE